MGFEQKGNYEQEKQSNMDIGTGWFAWYFVFIAGKSGRTEK